MIHFFTSVCSSSAEARVTASTGDVASDASGSEAWGTAAKAASVAIWDTLSCYTFFKLSTKVLITFNFPFRFWLLTFFCCHFFSLNTSLSLLLFFSSARCVSVLPEKVPQHVIVWLKREFCDVTFYPSFFGSSEQCCMYVVVSRVFHLWQRRRSWMNKGGAIKSLQPQCCPLSLQRNMFQGWSKGIQEGASRIRKLMNILSVEISI